MSSFHSHRLLHLSSGCSLAVFQSSSFSPRILLALSPDASFVLLQDSLDEELPSRVMLTRFVPRECRRAVQVLLEFHNKHCRHRKPYCAEVFHGSELHSGEDRIKWRVPKKFQKKTNRRGWCEVHSEPVGSGPAVVSKLSLCPFQQRVSLDILTTFYAESVLGNDDRKTKLRSSIHMEFAYQNCPVDLKSLVNDLLMVESVGQGQEEKSSGSKIFITNCLTSIPTSACNSNTALACFESLSSELSLLHNPSVFPFCDGTACIVAEQLDGYEDVNSDAKGKDWQGITVVYSNSTSDEYDKLNETPQCVEVQAWLNERNGCSSGVGGVITLKAEIIQFQLYAIAENDSSTGKSGSDESILLQHREFSVHLTLFESCDLDNDYYDLDHDEFSMPWCRLTRASLLKFTSIDLALHFKQLVVHMLTFRTHIRASPAANDLKSMESKNIGLVFSANRDSARNGCIETTPTKLQRDGKSYTTIDMYNPELSRQVQFLPKKDLKSLLGSNSNIVSSADSRRRLCTTIIKTTHNEVEGYCLTLLGNGTTRGVFRRDAMIIEYLPHSEMVKTLLGDGSERVLSAPVLTQMAMNSVASDSLLLQVSRNLLTLLEFRRYAVMPNDDERNRQHWKDKSTPLAIKIAQMRSRYYLQNHAS